MGDFTSLGPNNVKSDHAHVTILVTYKLGKATLGHILSHTVNASEVRDRQITRSTHLSVDIRTVGRSKLSNAEAAEINLNVVLTKHAFGLQRTGHSPYGRTRQQQKRGKDKPSKKQK